MTQESTILACLDDSVRAPLVYKTAIDLAKTRKQKLVLFQSVTVPVTPTEVGFVTPIEIGESLLNEARASLEKMRQADPVMDVRVELGVAWDAICRIAKEENASLIVLGSHEYGGLDRVLGTTAAKVVNHADCSVLVVRADREAH